MCLVYNYNWIKNLLTPPDVYEDYPVKQFRLTGRIPGHFLQWLGHVPLELLEPQQQMLA